MMTAGLARPFPWRTLDAIARDEVTLIGRLGRLLGGTERLADSARAIEAVIGCAVGLRLHAVEPVAAAADGLALAVSLVVDDTPFVVEIEAELAVDIIARALRRPSPPPASLDASALHATAGAFAAVLTKALRRAHAPRAADIRVVGAGPAPSVLAATELPDPSAAVYTIVLEADVYRARVVFSRRLAAAAPEPLLGAPSLVALGGLRLRVPVVASVAWSTPRELAGLRVGDAWLSGARDIAALPVILAGARVDRGLSATLENDRVVLGETVEDLTMTNAAQDTLLESALDAPIVVRVEIGSVELPAREWASLKPGDVVTLDRRVGAQVLLRAGGAELGRGDLVDVDGEIGVRIASLVSEAP